MEPEAKYTLVGAAALILVALLAAAIMWIRSSGEGANATRYKINFQRYSLEGLEPRSYVTMRGMKVGSVSSFRFSAQDKGAVEVIIAVDPGTPVRLSTTRHDRAAHGDGARHGAARERHGGQPAPRRCAGRRALPGDQGRRLAHAADVGDAHATRAARGRDHAADQCHPHAGEQRRLHRGPGQPAPRLPPGRCHARESRHRARLPGPCGR